MNYPDPGKPHGLTTTLKVGMEVHVELATRSKMWTDAPNVAHTDFADAEPNTLLDPVVIGLPGTLPVINRAAVEMSIRVGLALNCSIAKTTKWDRKSYYYPDLPKNYQISQYDLPLCYDGALDIELSDADAEDGDGDLGGGDLGTKRIGIIRAHLEEDAGKLMHEWPANVDRPNDGSASEAVSLIDLNRAGTPLLEIVSEPDMTSADQAVAFGQALRDVCRSLGVTNGVMQQGHIRFEPNINVIITKADGQQFATPVVEIKNLNSFKAVHGSIVHEHHRQVEQWLEDGKVMGARAKSTRGWDDERAVTTVQREKEDADEYRYFPDPDLVPLDIDDDWLNTLKADQPELPAQRRERYIEKLGLREADADQLLAEPADTAFFESCLLVDTTGELPEAEPRRIAAMLLNAGAKYVNEKGCSLSELTVSPTQVADIVALQDSNKISANAADKLFGIACEPGHESTPAMQLAEQHQLLQISDDSQLETWIDAVLAEPKNEKIVNDIREGKGKAIGALLGQVMKLSKGQANPKAVGDAIQRKLKSR